VRRTAVVALVAMAFIVGLALGTARTLPTAQLGRIKDQLSGGGQGAGTGQGAIQLGAADKAFTANADIVMVGDSLTQFGRWNEVFPGVSVANRGIAGDTVAGLLKRIEIIRAVRAEQTFLMIGINDLIAGRAVSAIAKDYEAAVIALKPGTRLSIQSTLPCSSFRCDRWMLGQVAQLNTRLRAIAARHHVGFIDVAGELAPDGSLPEAATADGVHLSAKGYRKWQALLAPQLVFPTKNTAQNSAEPL
jgi:lysophospholipase L1-like esterase